MHGCGALAVDPLAIGSVERPDAVQFEAAVGTDARFGDADGIKRLDRVQANVGQMRLNRLCGHTQSLAEAQCGPAALLRKRGASLRNQRPAAAAPSERTDL